MTTFATLIPGMHDAAERQSLPQPDDPGDKILPGLPSLCCREAGLEPYITHRRGSLYSSICLTQGALSIQG